MLFLNPIRGLKCLSVCLRGAGGVVVGGRWALRGAGDEGRPGHGPESPLVAPAGRAVVAGVRGVRRAVGGACGRWVAGGAVGWLTPQVVVRVRDHGAMGLQNRPGCPDGEASYICGVYPRRVASCHPAPPCPYGAGAALRFCDPPLAIPTRLGGTIGGAALYYVGAC